MIELQPASFAGIQDVFAAIDYHLALRALAAGRVPARVFLDDPHRPGLALVWARHRLYLAGSLATPHGGEALAELFRTTIRPEAQAQGLQGFLLFPATAGWADAARAGLAAVGLVATPRQHYMFRQLRHDARAELPAAYTLRPVDAGLLADTRLANRAALEDELRSERPSTAEFLAQSFGTCLIYDSMEIAGWCLSEYNVDDRCEVGIEVVEEHRGQGLGTLLASAFVEQARAEGIAHIGWDCFAANEPSGATARAAGFALSQEYTAFFGRFI